MDVESIEKMRERAEQLKSTNPKAVKAFAILESLMNTANAITTAAKIIPKYKLPRIALAARRRKALGIVKMQIIAHMGRAQVYQIASQPIPRYPNGGTASGFAIVGESRAEIIKPGDSIK